MFVVCDCCFFFKQKTAYEMRISDWSSDVCSSDLGPLAAMGEAAGDLFTPPRVRALLAALTDNSGTIGRAAVEEQLNALTPDERPQLRKLGLTIGSPDIFHPLVLKPEARSEEHTSELQSLMRHSYAVFCLKKKTARQQLTHK